MRIPVFLTGIVALLVAPSASAEVFQKSPSGFVIRHGADVASSADEAWKELIAPRDWWSSEHTFSGDAANLSIDARAGGCFCEVLPAKDAPRAAPRGGVEHMRIIYVERGRALRLSGALGPLQSEAVTGRLTINFRPIEGGGTRILWEYVVGGYMRHAVDEIAPAVDAVLGQQLAALAGKLGLRSPTSAEAALAPDPKPAETGR